MCDNSQHKGIYLTSFLGDGLYLKVHTVPSISHVKLSLFAEFFFLRLWSHFVKFGFSFHPFDFDI